MRLCSAVKPRQQPYPSRVLVSLTSPPRSLAVCLQQCESDASDLGLVLRAPEDRGLAVIRSSPPIPISRRAAGNGWELNVAVQRAIVEPELA